MIMGHMVLEVRYKSIPSLCGFSVWFKSHLEILHFHKTTFESQNTNAITKSRFWACYCAMFQLELNECWVILYKSISLNKKMKSALP